MVAVSSDTITDSVFVHCNNGKLSTTLVYRRSILHYFYSTLSISMDGNDSMVNKRFKSPYRTMTSKPYTPAT